MPSQDGITEYFLPSSLEHIPMARNVTAINFSITTSDICSLRYIGPNGTIYITASNAEAIEDVEDGGFSFVKPSVPSNPYLEQKSRKYYSTVSRDTSTNTKLPKLPTSRPSGQWKISAQ
jgi:hypothetical protein